MAGESLNNKRAVRGVMVNKVSDTKEKDKLRRDKLSGFFLDIAK